MSATMSSAPLATVRRSHAGPLVIVLAAWLAAVLALGANGAFMAPPQTPPLALLIGFVAPIATGVIAYALRRGFATGCSASSRASSSR